MGRILGSGDTLTFLQPVLPGKGGVDGVKVMVRG